jgi:hypothetical protein
VPLIQTLTGALGSVMGITTSGAGFLLAMLAISVVCNAILMVGSITLLVSFTPRFLIICLTSFSSLGSIAYMAFATVGTGITYGASSALNGLSEGIGIKGYSGIPFVTLAWVGAVFTQIGGIYWFILWFVEWRRTAFKRRARTPDQIGNYRGILREFKSDMFLHEEHRPIEKKSISMPVVVHETRNDAASVHPEVEMASERATEEILSQRSRSRPPSVVDEEQGRHEDMPPLPSNSRPPTRQ